MITVRAGVAAAQAHKLARCSPLTTLRPPVAGLDLPRGARSEVCHVYPWSTVHQGVGRLR